MLQIKRIRGVVFNILVYYVSRDLVVYVVASGYIFNTLETLREKNCMLVTRYDDPLTNYQRLRPSHFDLFQYSNRVFIRFSYIDEV